MRISQRENDAGFVAWQEIYKARQEVTVTFDGNPVDRRYLITADEEESFIERMALAPDGKTVLFDKDGIMIGVPAWGEVKITTAERPYSAAEETAAHIEKVRGFMQRIIDDLYARAQVHDESKFSEAELPHLQKMGELVRSEGKVAFGTPEYEARRAILGPMLEHHYRHNDHHPERFHTEYGGQWIIGLMGMNLMSLTEMFADWCAAAADRSPDGIVDIGMAADRFQMSPMLLQIFRNTADTLGVPHK